LIFFSRGGAKTARTGEILTAGSESPQKAKFRRLHRNGARRPTPCGAAPGGVRFSALGQPTVQPGPIQSLSSLSPCSRSSSSVSLSLSATKNSPAQSPSISISFHPSLPPVLLFHLLLPPLSVRPCFPPRPQWPASPSLPPPLSSPLSYLLVLLLILAATPFSAMGIPRPPAVYGRSPPPQPPVSSSPPLNSAANSTSTAGQRHFGR